MGCFALNFVFISLERQQQTFLLLETEERAKGEPGNRKRKKLHLTSQSADSSAAATASQTHSVPLDDSPVQLVWGYKLRQLKRVGEEHAQWQLHDTSQSGITGPSGKYVVHRELVALKVGVSAAYEADMLTHLAETAGVIQLVEEGTLPSGLLYVITHPFGRLLASDDNAELSVKVFQGAASIIQQLACRTPPVLHRDISVRNLIIYHGDDQSTFLIDFGTAVVAPTGCLSAMDPQSITGTSAFIARSVLEVHGAVLWGNKPIGSIALGVKVATVYEQEGFEKYVLQRRRSDLVQAVKRLRGLFWQPTYLRSATPLQFCQALQPA
ncbi:hypothetical protein WJX77_006407 [Trebouxia sp. C0004]